MALINCPECGAEVSDRAPSCPKCGAPIANKTEAPQSGDYIPYTDQEVQMMLSKKHSTSHILHLILSIITAGVWVIVWILVAINNNIENARIDRRITKGKKLK